MGGEISVGELWGAAVRGWWRVVLGLAVGLGVGAVLWSVLPERWEGRVLLRVGLVGGKAIEPVEGTRARMSSAVFQNAVMERVRETGMVEAVHLREVEGAFRQSMQVQIVGGGNLLECRVWGPSRDIAASLLTAVSERVTAEHAAESARLSAGPKGSLEAIEEELQRVDGEREATVDMALRGVQDGDSGLGALLALVSAELMSRQEARLLSLHNSKRDLERSLSDEFTYPSSVVGTPYVGVDPVAPQRAPIALASAFVGVLGGLWAAIVRYRRAQRGS